MTTALYAPARGINALAFGSGVAAFAAGLLTAFTISVGGEMPVGELVHDMARGWARMVFLVIDIVAVAYLFGCSKLNLLLFVGAEMLGDALQSAAFGALYGDWWKFGFGVPLTYLVLFLASLIGRPALIAAAFFMSAVHFVLDYRSFGGLCLVAGTATLITLFPRRVRMWLIIPAVGFVAIGVGSYLVAHDDSAKRSTRSDISRQSMLIAAYQGFRGSPIVGQGAWFSHSDVYPNFMAIRARMAKEMHIGGFPEAHDAPGAVAIHSQILVALAEGGIFGAAFFLAFGVALLGIGIALSVLSKGLIGIVIPAAVAALYLLWQRDWSLLWRARPWWARLW